MNMKSNPFTQIDREYTITSKELKEKLDIKGEIISLGLQAGRSPDDIEKGISPDLDIWYIKTKEVIDKGQN